MKKLIDLDKFFFVKINKDWTNHFFDQLMPFFRQPLFWIPLYLFLIIFVIVNFRKQALLWILLVAVTISASDFISSHILKSWVGRLRPCNDFDMASNLRLLVSYCGQNGSFPSSHATNHFAIAMFLFITLKPIWGNWCWLFFLWAALISYAQIYVGVHFPLDVIGGTLIGCLLGSLSANYFIKKSGTLTSV